MIGVKGYIIISGEHFNSNEYGTILILVIQTIMFPFFTFELKHPTYYFNVLPEKERTAKYEMK